METGGVRSFAHAQDKTGLLSFIHSPSEKRDCYLSSIQTELATYLLLLLLFYQFCDENHSTTDSFTDIPSLIVFFFLRINLV
jgi:hypothetical protein